MSRKAVAVGASALLVVLAVSWGSGPVGAQTAKGNAATGVPMDTTEAAVTHEVLKAVKEAFAAGATASRDMSRFVWDSPDFAFLTPDGRVYSYAEFMRFWEGFVSQLSAQRMTIRTERVVVLGPDQALYVWQGADELVRKDGAVLRLDPYCGTYLYRKINGEWRMAHGHESGLPPAVAGPGSPAPTR